MDNFRRHGAELDAAGKKRIAEIDVELTKQTIKFAENVLDSTNEFELIIRDQQKLAGLPEGARGHGACQRGFQRDRRNLPGDSHCKLPATSRS